MSHVLQGLPGGSGGASDGSPEVLGFKFRARLAPVQDGAACLLRLIPRTLPKRLFGARSMRERRANPTSRSCTPGPLLRSEGSASRRCLSHQVFAFLSNARSNQDFFVKIFCDNQHPVGGCSSCADSLHKSPNLRSHQELWGSKARLS